MIILKRLKVFLNQRKVLNINNKHKNKLLFCIYSI